MSLSISHTVANGATDFELLPATDDVHGGVTVNIVEAMDPALFHTMLISSMLHWKKQGKKGVWIKLPIAVANLVDPALKQGFRYHHAEPDYIMLVHWIPETTSTIPANASHRVGVGAIVFNDKKEILVVQEKSGVFRGTGIWKIPTGVVDEGEDIFTAAMREVKEETQVDTEFLEILGFRQAHKSFFKKSDLLFICMLRPLSFEIQKQELEIEDAQWMPFEEYAAQPAAKIHELFKLTVELCSAKMKRDYTGFSPVPIKSASNALPSCVYLNMSELGMSGSDDDNSQKAG
ncbi:Nudix hydrolase 2 [Linum perenne]